MCRELYGQDDMERPDLFNHMFQISVMAGDYYEVVDNHRPWSVEFGLLNFVCNRTVGEAMRSLANLGMVRDASVAHRCEQNQVFRLDSETGEAYCVCHPGRLCDTGTCQNTVGIVLASLIIALLLLLFLTTAWGVLRNTSVEAAYAEGGNR